MTRSLLALTVALAAGFSLSAYAQDTATDAGTAAPVAKKKPGLIKRVAGDIGHGAKKGASGIVHGTEKVAKGTGHAVETVSKDTVKGAEKVGKGTVHGAEKVGRGTVHGVEKVGHESEKAGKGVVHGAEHLVGKGPKKTTAPATETAPAETK